MGSLIKSVARWLVWQVGEHAAVTEPGQARITFYSAKSG
jgi:hypothetical protein